MADARYVIVGNGIAGTSAADVLRKNDTACSITIIAGEPYPLYNRLGLPPFLKRKVARERLIIKPLEWHERNRIDLRLGTWAKQAHAEEHVLELVDGTMVPYDKLLLAMGGNPTHESEIGLAADPGLIMRFQTLDESIALDERMETARSAIALGGSFIAYELAEAFHQRGLHTTWVMRGPWFLHRVIDELGGRLVRKIAEDDGVEMITSRAFTEVRGKSNGAGQGATLTFADGETLSAEMVGGGLGLTRPLQFLDASGVKRDKGAYVDERLHTNLPDVMAVGDLVERWDPTHQVRILCATWNDGAAQGKAAARIMAGSEELYTGVPDYSSPLFETKIAVIGITSTDSLSWADEARNYRLIFFDGDHVVGAALIGERSLKKRLTDLIASREPVTDRQALIETPPPAGALPAAEEHAD